MAEWTTSLLDDTLERLDAALDAERAAARGRERAREAGAGGSGQGGAAAGGTDDVVLMANLPSFGEKGQVVIGCVEAIQPHATKRIRWGKRGPWG